MYDPPAKPPRPFAADYPDGAPADATGRLTQDTEGRPLGARFVVGRSQIGGIDTPLGGPEALFSLASNATGSDPQVVAGSAVGNNAGLYVKRPSSDGDSTIREILLRRGLSDAVLPRVLGHEVSHAIDELAGQIDTAGLSQELKANYNTLNNPNRTTDGAASWGKPFTPQALGYQGADVAREYMAEAIRAYLADPNYLKTVAPKTAAAIRAAVNANPRLSKIIQFNGVAAAPLLGGFPQQTGDDHSD